jgi:hypothetical protein
VCWQLAHDHGLAIATLMQTAQRDIVERGRFSAKVDAGMTGARTTAGVLAGLPLLGVGLGQLIGAEPVSFLLSGGMGGWLLVIGVALASGSHAAGGVDGRRGLTAVSPARTCARESAPITSAAAKSKAAQLMSPPAR